MEYKVGMVLEAELCLRLEELRQMIFSHRYDLALNLVLRVQEYIGQIYPDLNPLDKLLADTVIINYKNLRRDLESHLLVSLAVSRRVD